MSSVWAESKLQGKQKEVKKVYVVDSDFGTDVFESAKGAVRFVVRNIQGHSSIRYVELKSVFGRANWKEDISGEINQKLTGDARFNQVAAFNKDVLEDPRLIKELTRAVKTPNSKLSIQSGELPVNVYKDPRYNRDIVNVEQRVIVFNIYAADFFKGTQYPSYVAEPEKRRSITSRAEREEFLGDATTFDRDYLADIPDDEINSLWEEMEMDDWLNELDRESS